MKDDIPNITKRTLEEFNSARCDISVQIDEFAVLKKPDLNIKEICQNMTTP